MYFTRMFLRLRECSVQRSILGEWSGLDYGVELQDTLMLGTDYYLTESGIASLLAEGKVPIGIGNASLTRTLMEFQRIFELKGLKKVDQQSILDDFNKHGPGFLSPLFGGQCHKWFQPTCTATGQTTFLQDFLHVA
uniref:Uncharacterized protein n=1 Tax=Brassica oleracea TaxID=3712 RepID=A0A3P6DNX6_BRAOL|nr:unnamed protein product [Brassica oleracea]